MTQSLLNKYALMFAYVLCLLTVVGAQDKNIITPGSKMGSVKIGAPLSDFKAAFKSAKSIYGNGLDMCGGSAYQWLDYSHSGNSVFAYAKSDKIYQLSVHTPRFALANRLKVGDSEFAVKRAYPQGKRFVLKGSGMRVVGGRDLQYWVDSSAGVAFELYWDGIRKGRFVSGIDIFSASAKYLPEGCITPPREWVENADK